MMSLARSSCCAVAKCDELGVRLSGGAGLMIISGLRDGYAALKVAVSGSNVGPRDGPLI
jgi:hypothetical protein